MVDDKFKQAVDSGDILDVRTRLLLISQIDRGFCETKFDEYLDYAKKLRFSGVYVVKEDEKLDIYSLINDNVTETDIKTLKSF